MIQKRENCLYCGNKMESITAKKMFCSDKCKVYYGREKKRGTLSVHVTEEFRPRVVAESEYGVKEEEIAEFTEPGLDKAEIMDRIKQLKQEIANPIKTKYISQTAYIQTRQIELKKLEALCTT